MPRVSQTLVAANWLFESPSAASGGGLTVALSTIVPLDSTYEVETADVRHNGVNPSHVAIALVRGGDVVLLASSRQSGPGTPVNADEAVYLPRPVKVPPGWQLLFIALVLAAGEQVMGRMVWRRVAI